MQMQLNPCKTFSYFLLFLFHPSYPISNTKTLTYRAEFTKFAFIISRFLTIIPKHSNLLPKEQMGSVTFVNEMAYYTFYILSFSLLEKKARYLIDNTLIGCFSFTLIGLHFHCCLFVVVYRLSKN